ncbi:MAG TPA: hypothetical protein VI078_13775 [bacterium]
MPRFAPVLVTMLWALSLVAGAAPAHAGPAVTDTSYFDGFLDLIGIDPYKSTDVELDALGGVRMKGNGTSEAKLWTSQTDFEGSISYRPTLFIDNPAIPLATLDAATAAGSLVLPTTPYAFRRVAPDAVLLPAEAISVDGYGVAGMCVRRIDGPLGTYYMWYTGIPENEHTARLYLATSPDGQTWTRQNFDPIVPTLQLPVLDVGVPGAFDSRQLGKPSVVYNPSPAPGDRKFKMWYTAEGDLTGSIGYATSDDGVVWDKWVPPIVTLDGAATDAGQHPSLAVGADGLPIAAYYDVTDGDLKFVHCGNAFCSDGNTVVTLDRDGDVGRFASLGVAGDGLPVVSYYDLTNGALKVVHCGTAACMVGNTLTTLDGAAPESDVGQYTSLVVDANGYPQIAYYDVTGGALKFVGCTDFACSGGDEVPSTVDGAAAESDVGRYASLAMVARDPLVPTTRTPAIAYYDVTNQDLKYVACDDALCAGGDEAPVTLDPDPPPGTNDVGQYASLAVSPGGLPAVAYYDATATALKFVACSNAVCTTVVPPITLHDDAATDSGRFSRLIFGADGMPVVGAYDATSGDILLIACNDALCSGDDEVPTVVGNAGAIDVATVLGRQLALALVGGVPHVAYYDATNGDLTFVSSSRGPTAVLGPGLIGSIDSYSVAHPAVMYDNGIYRMWYTANDSNNRRIAYASSSDGVTWARGGLVVNVGNTANDGLGAWAPSVTKDASEYKMAYTGWKTVSGGMTVQAKLLLQTSPDGTTWTKGNVLLGSGTRSSFDGDNLSQGSIIYDAADAGAPYKMWYVGNTVDTVTGTYHDRIGYATKGLTGSWGKVAGSGGQNSVLGLGPQSPAFDSLYAYDLRVVPDPADAAKLLGFYTGRNGADFKDRIGVVESIDGGETWSDNAAPDPLVNVGAGGTPSERGVATPAPVFLGTGSGWLIYHTAVDGSLAPGLALHSAPDDLSAATPVGDLSLTGGTFDAGGRTDPHVVADGTALTLFYAGLDAGDVGSICMAGGTTATPLAFGTAAAILSPGPDAYDLGGLRRPVAWRDGAGQWQLWYTAVGTDGVERIAHASSANGTVWTKSGLAVMPSTTPYDFAERGVWPSSAWTNATGGVSLAFTGVDRFGWRRAGLAAATGPGHADGASATYQTPDDATLASAGYLPRDWRAITWNPASQAAGAAEVWVSYYPTYSGLWSNFFKIDNDTDLPFLLTVKGMRWQIRAAGDPLDAAVTPQLDDLTVDNAPIAFPATATAATLPIAPAPGWYLLDWGALTVTADTSGGSTLSVRIADQMGTTIVADQPVAATPVTLSGLVPNTSGPLTLLFTFTPAAGSPPASPLLKSVNVTFTSTDVPSSITLGGEPNPLPYGGATATLSGWLTSNGTPLQPQTTAITLSKRLVTDAAYTVIGPATVQADGSFVLAGLTQDDDTIYKAEWPGETIAGTTYPPAMSTFVLQMAPVTLSFRAVANPILYNKSTTLRGSLISSTALGDTPVVGETVLLSYRLPTATTYTDLGSATTGADGSFAYATPVAPKKNTVYRALWRSKGNVEFTLGVKPVVSLNLVGYTGRLGNWFRYPLGRSVTASGGVAPNHRLLGDGVTLGKVVLVVERQTTIWRGYRRFYKILTSTSTYRNVWLPTLRGKYRIKATFPADTDHSSGWSAVRYIQVY